MKHLNSYKHLMYANTQRSQQAVKYDNYNRTAHVYVEVQQDEQVEGIAHPKAININLRGTDDESTEQLRQLLELLKTSGWKGKLNLDLQGSYDKRIDFSQVVLGLRGAK